MNYPSDPLFFSTVVDQGTSRSITAPQGLLLTITSVCLVWTLAVGMEKTNPARACPYFPYVDQVACTMRYLLEATSTSFDGSPQSCVIAVLKPGSTENVQCQHTFGRHPISFYVEEVVGSSGQRCMPGLTASVHIAGYYSPAAPASPWR